MKRESNAIAAVKARANIAEIIGRYVDLRPVGSRLVGACPFHQETKGSFNVDPEKGFFHCFGCQASGDVIDFYCRINGLEFKEGLERLAAELGVDIGLARSDPRAAARRRERDECLAMHDLADRYFRHVLTTAEGARARAYLERRRLSPEMIERFGLGMSPDGWQGLAEVLRKRGFSQEAGVLAGLLSAGKGRTWDRFRGRLMFPIRDGGGRVIAFGGRTMGDEDPKYLNSAETPIYTKGKHLYGLFEARPVFAKTRRALLTEGYIDVITLHQYGYGEACGVLGTALTAEQVRRLSGFAGRIDLVFDGDAAGRKAALRAAPMLLSVGAGCRVVPLPDGEDVDSLLHAAGRDGFEDCLAKAEDGLAYCLRVVRETFSPREMANWATQFLAELGDASLRAVFIPRVAGGLGLAETELRQGVAASEHRAARRPSAQPASRPARLTMTARDAQLLSFVIRAPDSLPALAEAGLAEALSGREAREFFAKLVGRDADELAARLETAETAFWTKVQLEPPLDEQEKAAVFEEIRVFLQEARENDRRRSLTEAIRRAQERGAHEEALALLGQLQALSGRGDE